MVWRVIIIEKDSISRIKVLLKAHPKGLTITDISSKLKINRNSVSKYLEVLLISGQVETLSYGTAHVFFLTHRIPISAMLSISSHLVLTLDESNKVLFCNDNFLTFFGIARDQIVGHHIIEIYRLDIPNIIFSELFSDILANPDNSYETAITRQNETYYFRIKGVRTVFDDGCRGITIVMVDETKDRKYQIELEKNEAQYRGIVEDQTEFICRFLPTGIITFINNSFAKFLNRTTENLVNKSRIPGLSSEDAILWSQACSNIDRECMVTTTECRISDDTGRQRWTAWTIRGLFDGTDECREYQAVGRDITEKKEADAQLQKHVTQMEFFSTKMQVFSEMPPDVDIYAAIGAGLYEFLPDAAITVNSYDPGTGTLTIRNLTSEQVRNSAKLHFGKTIEGLTIHVDENLPERVSSGKLNHLEKNLYNVLFRHLPKEPCEKITKALNLGEFYSVGLVWNGELFGNITFALQKGVPLTNAPLIEVYAQVASIAIQRRIAEDKLKENEQKLLEEALKGSENYLKTIFNSTQSGLVVIDPESHTVFDVNSTAIKLIGRKKSEIIGSSCKALFCLAEDDKCPVTDLHQKLARLECNLLANDGKNKTVLKTVVPVQISNRSYLLESILDISERKIAEDALKESEKKFRETVRFLDEGYYSCTPNGKLLEHNLAFNRILGINPAHELNGISLTDFWQDPVQRQKYLAELTKKGFIKNYQINAKTISGKEIILNANAHTIQDNGGRIIKIVGTFSDFTERKRDEDALRLSEEKYRTLFDSAGDGIFIHDMDAQILAVNRMACEQLGYTETEMLSMAVQEVDSQEDAVQAQDRIARIMKHDHISFETRHRCKDGSLIPYVVSAQRIAWGGQPAVMSICHDITERKRAEEIIRNSEERYRSLAETAQDFIYIIDKDDNVVYVNSYCEQTLKKTRDDIIGKPRKALFPEQVSNKQYQNLQQVFATGIPYHEVNNLLIYGQIFWQDTRLVPLRDDDGNISAVLGISRDITLLKQVEETLKESENNYRTVFENTGTATVVVEKDTMIILANEEFAQLSGFSIADIEGRMQWTKFIVKEDLERMLALHQLRRQEKTNALPSYEFRFVTRTGDIRNIYLTIDMIPGTTKSVASLLDITSRKRAETALQQANKKLTLLSSITRHDINNQLMVLQGYLNILEQKQSDVTLDEYFGKVSAAAQRISSMIQFTEEYEKIGIDSPIWQDCRTLIDTAAKQAPLEQVLLKNDLPANIEVFADPLIIKICCNLIDNAVRYGKKITTIRFSVQAGGDDHVVVCEDDGVGVPVQDKERIFEQGFGKNTGFGLALSREILSITGITIRETGEPGKGARFEMTVPKETWRMKRDGA